MQPKARFCTDWRRALLFLLGERGLSDMCAFFIKNRIDGCQGGNYNCMWAKKTKVWRIMSRFF